VTIAGIPVSDPFETDFVHVGPCRVLLAERGGQREAEGISAGAAGGREETGPAAAC